MNKTNPPRHRLTQFLAMVGAAAGLLVAVTTSAGDGPSRWRPQWSLPKVVINGAGCPIETPDGLSLVLAATGPGGNDIAVLDRTAIDASWGPLKTLPAPISSPDNDFCPAPVARSLFFVSNRATTCGGGPSDGGDIYLSRQSPAGDWSEPVHLACAADGGPNTPGTERSPSLVETWYGTFLFYSTNTTGVATDREDIYVSFMGEDGKFGPGQKVEALSTLGYEDQMPTVRAVGNGFEVTFNSNRPGTLGGQDVYIARSHFLPFKWSTPKNAGPNVNTADRNETRASLSWDGTRLYFGRSDRTDVVPPVASPRGVFVSERQ